MRKPGNEKGNAPSHTSHLSLLLCLSPSFSSWIWHPLHIKKHYQLRCPGVPAHSFYNPNRHLVLRICLEKRKRWWGGKWIPEKHTSRSASCGQGAGSGKDVETHFLIGREAVPGTGCMLFQPLWICPCCSVPTTIICKALPILQGHLK